jgi:acyl-CoA synthetase (AMP-forming)/AMP-acid ligase II
VTAYVVSVGAADAEADPQADAEAIRAALRNRLAAYKIPKQVILVSRLEDVQRLA